MNPSMKSRSLLKKAKIDITLNPAISLGKNRRRISPRV